MDTGIGAAPPMRPHALLRGVCDTQQDMARVLASTMCSLEEALTQPDAVRAVFRSVDTNLSNVDTLMHAFFKDTQAGQLAQAGVLERAVEEEACARVAGWLQHGGGLPSLFEAKHELEHACRCLHKCLLAYNDLCFRLNGLTDAFWRTCYDEVRCTARAPLRFAGCVSQARWYAGRAG